MTRVSAINRLRVDRNLGWRVSSDLCRFYTPEIFIILDIPCSKEGRAMTRDVHSYSLPDQLEPDISRVRAYWNGLKRGSNDIPFWDDVKFSSRSGENPR
jgi:hypothetical protein